MSLRVSFCRLVLVGRSRAVEHVKREHWRGLKEVTSRDQRSADGIVNRAFSNCSRNETPRA